MGRKAGHGFGIKERKATQEKKAQPTVPGILQQVCDDICDNYCRYRGTWDKSEDGLCDFVRSGGTCPLNRIY